MSPANNKILQIYSIAVFLCGLFYWPTKFEAGVLNIILYILSWLIIIISISAYGIVIWDMKWKKIIWNGGLALVGVDFIKFMLDTLLLRMPHDLFLFELLIAFFMGALFAGLGVLIGALILRTFEFPLE